MRQATNAELCSTQAKRCASAFPSQLRRLRAPLARDESNLPLPKPIERAILASDPARDLANVG